ncbi:sel1 repeat family protein [Rhodoferax sp. AJA081-3]|uniref:SEL1-like repeat protein n=1 Tax=Rhodoferax sp. AJA081-3 TaxID=2752316 RepID=UPI001ADF804A|nr:tetratricopeptide repeat protein [Rhodoferax sp. AJA081-3]QTN30253.1 sel1 repeat family protein [Rhodoferax sp. AJA081-3]
MSDSASDKRNFTRRLKEARIGDPAAQYDVALMYATGVGTGKNVAQAFAWTKAAADKGHVAAQYLLGSAYSGGLGTAKDEQKALFWFSKSYEHGNEKAALKLAKVLGTGQPGLALQFALEAAERGLADAQLLVAEAYATGLGTEQDTRLALGWYQRAAEQGLAAAQFALGGLHALGSGVARNVAVARQWYREAAAQGHPGAQLALEGMDAAGDGRSESTGKSRPPARERRTGDARWIKYAAHGRSDDFFHLGVMFEQGVAVEKNTKQARAWYKKAAEAGHADAQFALAQGLESAEWGLAAQWYERAAAQGHAGAQAALAELHLQGQGVAQDRVGALTGYANAAAQGLSTAQYALAQMLKKDAAAIAQEAISRAAAGGQPQAQRAMGDRYAHGDAVAQNWFDACRWYDLAAQQGDAEAQCALAGCYASGKGVKKDMARAFIWFEKAAAQNLPQAQWNLGELYATGIAGVEADAKKATQLCKRAANAGFAPASATLGALFARANKHDRAVQWWTLAAEQGDLEALFNLGQAHRLGLGVAKDEAKAFALMLQAAEGGVAAAQSRIGLAYATGEGAALDPIEACKWFELAAQRGDKAAAANRARARQGLGAAQLAEAERRAKVWTAAHENKT